MIGVTLPCDADCAAVATVLNREVNDKIPKLLCDLNISYTPFVSRTKSCYLHMKASHCTPVCMVRQYRHTQPKNKTLLVGMSTVNSRCSSVSL
jgi:hypothetical protein